MILCMVTDDNMGILFNNRRQSQDKLLREQIIEESKGRTLWLSTYSAKQFDVAALKNVRIDDNLLGQAEDEDLCFVENLSVANYENKIKKIILFKWNRTYPADTYFDIPLSKDKWQLSSVMEFKGNSHDKITKEVWIKNENI